MKTPGYYFKAVKTVDAMTRMGLVRIDFTQGSIFISNKLKGSGRDAALEVISAYVFVMSSVDAIVLVLKMLSIFAAGKILSYII